MGLPPQTYEDAEMYKVIPNAKWFHTSYAQNVSSRMNSLKASITPVFGEVLKIDATEIVCKKLARECANSASLALNIGNERGEIVQSVPISSESTLSLQPLANGFVKHYLEAKVDPAKLLYTDRDCCSKNRPSKFEILVEAWDQMNVRLDMWHVMRCLSVECCLESHSLYGAFMLSGCILEYGIAQITVTC